MKSLKGKTKFNLTKLIRIAIAISFFLIIIIISIYFLSRSRNRSPDETDTKIITPQKIETKEQIVHSEMKGERMNFRIKANKQYIGEDGKYHLEGNIEIIDFGKDKSEDIFMYGEKVIYDQDLTHIVLMGQGRVKYKDLIINSDLFDYDKISEIVKSDKGVNFSSRRIKGSAQKFHYSTKENTLVLTENIHLELKPKTGDDLPLTVKGNRLEYNRNKKTGEVTDEVYLSQGSNRASAKILTFMLSENEENVRNISLKENVKVFLVEKVSEKGNTHVQDDLGATSSTREIEADEINLYSIEGLSRVSSVEAEGNCLYKSTDNSGNSLEIQGQGLNFLFDPEGELQKLEAFKNVRMKEQSKNSEESRFLEGEEMIIHGDANILQIKGKDNIIARVSTQDSEVFAKEITIYLDNDNLEALGDVEAAFQGRGERETIGFFSEEQPVFITAQEMRYDSDEERFIFKNSSNKGLNYPLSRVPIYC